MKLPFGIILATFMSGGCGAEVDTSAATSDALLKMGRYCDRVRDAFLKDAADLSEGDQETKGDAEVRFLETAALHGHMEVSLCTEIRPELSKQVCGPFGDFPCLARLAHAAAGLVPLEKLSSSALPRLKERCDWVRFSVREAAHDYETHATMDRFSPGTRLAEDWVGYSRAEIEMCSPVAPDLSRLKPCREQQDLDCLAVIARTIELGIYVPGT